MASLPDPAALPDIAEHERTPTVRQLLAFIEQQHAVIQQQKAEIDTLEAELARLKKLPKRPKIRPSTLPKDDDPSDDDASDDDARDDSTPGSGRGGKGKTTKPRKRKKRLVIHETKIIKPKHLPEGSRLLGYENFTVQDLLIEPHTIRYRLARYQTPEGEKLIGVLPQELQGSHFGITLKSYILYQYYHQRVTQPLILQQLTEWGIDISSGQISNILIEDKDAFHTEKDDLLAAAINHSSYIQVDDTGSRHNGNNGYCTHVGNPSFAWFCSTGAKSRINFLQLLRGAAVDYTINQAAVDYMQAQGLPKAPLALIAQKIGNVFDDQTAWADFLQAFKITDQRHCRIATEGALLGTLIANGFPPDLVILSDDAGQFDVLLHALCWIHAERVFQRIVPLNPVHTKQLQWVHCQIWEIYADLKQYKRQQTAELKTAIEAHFDELCKTRTSFATLNQALKRLARNKEELLLVLQRPDIPLHNNLSESDIREYVIKRNISGSTRSEKGRLCRDTFASLKKTCKKHGISFWEFLNDRLKPQRLTPYLPDLLSGKACLVPKA